MELVQELEVLVPVLFAVAQWVRELERRVEGWLSERRRLEPLEVTLVQPVEVGLSEQQRLEPLEVTLVQPVEVLASRLQKLELCRRVPVR